VTPASFSFPTYRLSKLLRQPGGKTVAKAVRDAEENIAALAGRCLEDIDKVLVSVEALIAEIDPRGDAARFKRIYEAINGLIGLGSAAGLKDFDHAAYSLCDVLDRMLRSGRLDTAVVIVHVRAMHLLRRPEALASASAARDVLSGLKLVRDKVIASSRPEPGAEL